MTNERIGPHNPGVKWEGPDFDANKNEVAMESLEAVENLDGPDEGEAAASKVELHIDNTKFEAAGLKTEWITSLKTDNDVTDYAEGGTNVVENINVKYATENAAPDASGMAIEKIEIALSADEGTLQGKVEYPNAGAREAGGLHDSDVQGGPVGIKAEAIDMPVGDAVSLKAGASEVLMESVSDATGAGAQDADSLTVKMQNLLNLKGGLGPSHLLEPTGPDGAFMDYTDDGIVDAPDTDALGDGPDEQRASIVVKDDVTATFGINDQTPADWNEADAADAPDLDTLA